MSKRAVLYARVSGDDRGKDGRNLAGQLEMCREYAAGHGWQVVAELAEDERGVSGARMDAPQLSRAIDMAAAGQYDVLIVREIDRLARDVGKQYVVEGELKRCNVKIAYVLGEYPDTPEGELQKAIKAAIASYERTKIAERSIRGRRREAKRGSIMAHGNTPFGYNLIHDGDKYQLVIEEAQAEIVRLIFNWYTGDERKPVRRICALLNEANIPSATGVLWGNTQVNRMLSNETYAGRWYYGRRNKSDGPHVYNDPSHWICISVPAIIGSAVWEKAQERRQSNKALAARATKQDYLLRGRTKCGVCGRNMRLAISKGMRYYRCATLWDNNLPDCGHRTHYRQETVDAITWDWVTQVIFKPERLAAGWEQYRTVIEAETAPIRSQLAIVEDGLAKHRAQLAKVLDLYLSAVIEKDMLIERQQRLQTMIDSLSAQRDELARWLEGRAVTQEEFVTLQTFVGDLAARLDVGSYEGDMERMQQVIDMLDVKATVNYEDGERVLYLSCKLDSAVFLVDRNKTPPLRPACRPTAPENLPAALPASATAPRLSS